MFLIPGMGSGIIIRHGSYMTVYGNLASVNVKTGDRVALGQTIGHIPSAGEDAYLHFEIWKETPKAASDDVEAAAEDYVPYELTSQASSMEESWNMVSENGAEASWSEEDGQYYAEYVNGGETYKVWLEDAESMELRLKAASESKLAGMAFWKLGLEQSRIWDTILKYMN